LILEALGIIGQKSDTEEYHPTIGGLLLFGKSFFVPSPCLCKSRLQWRGPAVFRDILKMLDDVSDYMRSIIKVEGYPFNALEE